jgi:ribosomal protein L37E
VIFVAMLLVGGFLAIKEHLEEGQRARKAVDREERRAKERARRRGETHTPPRRRKRHAEPPARTAPAPIQASGQASAASARSKSVIPGARRRSADTTVVCEKCGASLDVSASFCSACGARSPLNPQPKDPAWEAERRSYIPPLGQTGSSSRGQPADGGE